jgi:hypothetical protein
MQYTDELTKQQQDITATIGDITQTKLTDATLERTSSSVMCNKKIPIFELRAIDMLPVLAMAVGSFTSRLLTVHSMDATNVWP